MNLVEQQNMLRELSDGQLTQAMNSGVAPQYLVVAEAKRREDARKRYAALKQKYDASQGTIAEQVLGGLGQSMMGMMGGAPGAAPASGGMPPGSPPGGLDMAMPPPMSPDAGPPGGLDAALPPDMGPQGFARGGAVHRYKTPGPVSAFTPPSTMSELARAGLLDPNMMSSADAYLTPMATVAAPAAAPEPAAAAAMGPLTYTYPEFKDPYAGIRELYAKQAADIDKEKERAAALALISAGVGIAGGKSQNFARNLAGAQDAIKGYGEQIGALNERQQALVQGQTNADVMSQQALNEMKKNFPNTSEGRRQMLEQMGVDTSTPEAQAYMMSGEGVDRLLGITNFKDMEGPFPGTDASGKEVEAWLDPVKGVYIDANRNPIPGFTKLTEAELAERKTEAVTRAKVYGNPNAYYNDIGAINEAARQSAQVGGLVADTKAALAQVPSTAGANVWISYTGTGPLATISSKLATLKSLVAQLQLQKMRNASQDGSSGLGQVTGRELNMLQEALGLLEMNQNKEDLIKNLDYVQATYGQMIENLRARFDSFWQDYKHRDDTYEQKMLSGTGTPLAPGGGGAGETPPAPERKKIDVLLDTIPDIAF